MAKSMNFTSVKLKKHCLLMTVGNTLCFGVRTYSKPFVYVPIHWAFFATLWGRAYYYPCFYRKNWNIKSLSHLPRIHMWEVQYSSGLQDLGHRTHVHKSHALLQSGGLAVFVNGNDLWSLVGMVTPMTNDYRFEWEKHSLSIFIYK